MKVAWVGSANLLSVVEKGALFYDLIFLGTRLVGT